MTFQLPERKRPASNSFDTGPESLMQWIADLPLANTGKTRELLDSALGELNTLELPAKVRLETLEELLQPVTMVLHSLKKSYLGKSAPVDAVQAGKSADCHALCRKVITGYEIIVEEQGDNTLNKGQLATAIYRALHFLGEALLNNYQTYVQYPAGIWHEVHSLYAIAEQQDLAARPVTDKSRAAPVTDAIDSRYIQILLLSLACPYHLRQNEIHLVNDALAGWAGNCRLTTADDMESSGLFAVNLDSDNPPAYRALREEGLKETRLRILDTTELQEELQGVLTELSGNTNGITGISDIRTLQRLMLKWGVMPQRRFARKRHEEAINMVVGLNAVHLVTPGADAFSKPAGASEDSDSGETLGDPTLVAPTQFDTRKPTDNPFEAALNARKEATRGAVDTSTADDISMESWKVADMSAGGYCLLHDSAEASRARIGELVAIANQHGQESDDWHLGVVRWMKFTTDRGLELGIQMLSPGAHAIRASLAENGKPAGDTLKGILLPGIEAINEQASLVIPTLPFRTGKTILLEQDTGNQTVTLARQVENTGSFAQYHFTPVFG